MKVETANRYKSWFKQALLLVVFGGIAIWLLMPQSLYAVSFCLGAIWMFALFFVFYKGVEDEDHNPS